MNLRDRDREEYRNAKKQRMKWASNRYFAGYDRYSVVEKSGKKKIVRVYTGIYHYTVESAARKCVIKLTFFFSAVMTGAVLLYLSTLDLICNRNPVVALCMALSILVLALFLKTSIDALLTPNRMTDYDYRTTSRRIIAVGFVSSGVLLAQGIASAVVSFLRAQFDGRLFLYLPISGFMLVCAMTERARKYEQEKSTDTPPPGAIRID